MADDYEMFQYAFGEYFVYKIDLNEAEEEKELRKDYCYDCKNEGYWVMMALRCEKCEKILIGD